MKLNKSKSGISLIVLVITIIVMIILAAAIILSISGSDIRGKAEEAVSATDMAAAKETVAVARSEWEVNYYKLKDKYNDSFKKYAEEKLKSAGIDYVSVSNDGAVNTIYKDKVGKTAIIPEGFSVSTVASEQTIADGLVIVDKNGNEFVWVPVDNINLFKRTTTYTGTTITDPESNYSEPYKELSLSNDPTGEVAEYTAMKASVEENKGFYIGRYEAGTIAERTNTANGTTEVVVQKNKPVYNYVGWGPSMTDVTGDVTYSNKNQGKGAVELSRQMYKGSKSVVSTLCYGVQWDAALRFIATKDATYPTNSDGKGYYAYDEDSNEINPTEVQVAGSNDNYAVNNIYDMAGNLEEWIMEAHSSSDRGLRGGALYNDGGAYYSASFRSAMFPEYSDGANGFRLTLYIK